MAGYVAIGSEADPARLLAQAAEQGGNLALPYVERRSVPMRFLRWAPGAPLVRGQMGLLQPDLANAEVRRISLDPNDDEFMPAEGKTPLTDQQVQIIRWWIEARAPNGGRSGALEWTASRTR